MNNAAISTFTASTLQMIAKEIFAFEDFVLHCVKQHGEKGFAYSAEQWNLFANGVRDSRLGDDAILLIDSLGMNYVPLTIKRVECLEWVEGQELKAKLESDWRNMEAAKEAYKKMYAKLEALSDQELSSVWNNLGTWHKEDMYSDYIPFEDWALAIDSERFRRSLPLFPSFDSESGMQKGGRIEQNNSNLNA